MAKKVKDLGLGKNTVPQHVPGTGSQEFPEALKNFKNSNSVKSGRMVSKPLPKGIRYDNIPKLSEEDELKRLIEIEQIPKQRFLNRKKNPKRFEKKKKF